MLSVIPSMDGVLQGLMFVFTHPSYLTHRDIFLGWIMCFGRRTEFRVFETINERPVSRVGRHPFDRFYNFFSRSAWTVQDLAHALAVQIVLRLNPEGELHLIVDGTLLHKSGAHVYGIGWFHDPVASTKKRVATALGNKWVVMGLLVSVPGVERKFCLPIHAMLDIPGEKLGEAKLARKMLEDVLRWFPDRQIILTGDGGFSASTLLRDLDSRVRYVGLMRSDAALYSPRIPRRPKSKRGPKPKKGKRLPGPKAAAAKLDKKKNADGSSQWKMIEIYAYGQVRQFQIHTFEAKWPTVFGGQTILVVLSRSLDKGYGDVYLYTTDLSADPSWVVRMYAFRNTIEGVFKTSKQVMEIQQPQHWCQSSIEKLSPWVWFAQSIVALWYLSEGRHLPEAEAARAALGPWETEWSFQHMFRLLRRLTLRQAIQAGSHKTCDLLQLIENLENYLYLAV